MAQLLINAVIGEVESEQNHMSGNPTNQELAFTTGGQDCLKAALEISEEPLTSGAAPNPATAWTIVFRQPVHKLTHSKIAKYCTPRSRIVIVYAYSCISKLFGW